MEPLVRCRTGGWWQGTRLFLKNFCKIKKKKEAKYFKNLRFDGIYFLTYWGFFLLG